MGLSSTSTSEEVEAWRRVVVGAPNGAAFALQVAATTALVLVLGVTNVKAQLVLALRQDRRRTVAVEDSFMIQAQLSRQEQSQFVR
mmetsp:Transcript_27299/g.56921  ORF Transcript_27299/g.56921 Transcript_27299/m.56921 type:complete len:86 (-) Transcript_27299:42-299(-)